jgi:hypothetical protein
MKDKNMKKYKEMLTSELDKIDTSNFNKLEYTKLITEIAERGTNMNKLSLKENIKNILKNHPYKKK